MITKASREDQRVRASRAELLELFARALPRDGSREACDGVFLARLSAPTQSPLALFKPAFCCVVHGSKQALVGEEVLRYDPGNYLLFTVDLPLVFHVEKATEADPYFGLRINLDPALVASVLMESGTESRMVESSTKAIGVKPLGADLLDAVVRLVRLTEKPNDQRILAPLIQREIICRLLLAGEGARLGHLVGSSSGDTYRMSRAIAHLREHYKKPMKMEELARELGMSVSGFHHHFKSVTSMSPLQFQQQVRLREARGLMLTEGLDASTAGHRVGYEDPAHFNRRYKKLFGAPPQRDIAALRDSLNSQSSPQDA